MRNARSKRAEKIKGSAFPRDNSRPTSHVNWRFHLAEPPRAGIGESGGVGNLNRRLRSYNGEGLLQTRSGDLKSPNQIKRRLKIAAPCDAGGVVEIGFHLAEPPCPEIGDPG